MSSKAFAVYFGDLYRWDPSSFHQIRWYWPDSVLRPIGSFLTPRKEKVKRSDISFADLQPITIHFDGSVDMREVDADREYSMELYFAHPGDIVVAKIDLKNGAVGIVPNWNNVVVTGHFALYEPNREAVVPEYFHAIIQTRFFKDYLWRNKVGAEGRKEVKLDFFESIRVPIPPLPTQRSILEYLQRAKDDVQTSQQSLSDTVDELQTQLQHIYQQATKRDVIHSKYFALKFGDLGAWDCKSGHAAAFRIACPDFRPMGDFIEDATELVRPVAEPAKAWPVYGVNNRVGVFFNMFQKGEDFNAPYKRIRKDWFFHNPTRCNVGSLGIVPDVPEDAITSPEYQVWKLRDCFERSNSGQAT